MKSPRKTGFHKLASLLLLAFAAAFGTSALAQEPPAAPVPKVPKDVPAQPAPKPQDTQAQAQAPANQNLTDSQTILRVNVNYVFLPVTVKDSSGRLVADLTRNEFRIFDDNVEQRLEFFSAEAFPLSQDTQAQAQAPANQNLTDSQTILRVNVNYVFLPVTVKDSSGRLVADLTRNEFRIFDDN